jgi:regulator of replication initiation timing
LKDTISELRRNLKLEKSNLAVEKSENERLSKLTDSMKLEISQVSSRLNKMVSQNTDLKIEIRKLKDSSGTQGIEKKMIEKVQELEKNNLETLLKTYKGDTKVEMINE